MKIGILTFHRAKNFGAFLQAFSLQEYLKSLEHNVEIIDYRCNAIEQSDNLFDFKSLFKRKNILKSIHILFNKLLTIRYRIQKRKKYEVFRNKFLNISSVIYRGIEDFNNNDNYDVYVCGSDQVWNMKITQGVDPVYFLTFHKNDKHIKKIAYAASSEVYSYALYVKNKEILSSLLAGFDAISVREDSLAEELQKYTDNKIETVLDPTFLFDKLFYQKLITEPNSRNYVLVYHLFESKDASQIARQIAKEKNLSVIEIHAGFNLFTKENHKQGLDPSELLGYIFHAKYILTTSFHGTALSLILNKNFFVVNKGSNSRMKNLLKHLNLEERLVDVSKYKMIKLDIDYHSVNKKLSILIEQSKSFITRNL
jgi:hypothetical protein